MTGGAEHIVLGQGLRLCLVVVPSEDAEPVAAGAPAGAPLESESAVGQPGKLVAPRSLQTSLPSILILSSSD